MNRCRCIHWKDGEPCCRERTPLTTGAALDKIVRGAGCFSLTNLSGDRVFFYPRRGVPKHVSDILSIGDNLEMLRDYLITQARVARPAVK